jgi:hypothetical protein
VRRVVGYALRVQQGRTPEQDEYFEAMVREVFRDRHEVEPDKVEWLWEAGGAWTDPETGEEYAWGPSHLLVAEATVDEP